MEKIDLELKQIQLAREKIALEKDLREKARREMWVNSPRRSLQRILSSLGRVFTWIVGFFTKWWLAFVGGAIALSISFGLVMWVKTTNETERQAAEQRYRAAANEYVEQKCVPEQCKGSAMYESPCFNNWLEDGRCRRDAHNEFQKIWEERKKSQ